MGKEIDSAGRKIASSVPATNKGGPISRLIGTLDIDGNGTLHPLDQVDPFLLLDQGTITKNGKGIRSHPHRGHSVVTLLLQGTITSWDSITQKSTTVNGPASYWVDAASGLFHEETSVIDDEGDVTQHAEVFQLWICVKEVDRLKPPSLQYDTNLPLGNVENSSGEVVGSMRYFVGGDASIKTMHPVTVGLVEQQSGTTARIPVDPKAGAFIVHIEGEAVYGDGTDKTCTTNTVLVLADTANDDDDDAGDFVQVAASSTSTSGCRYLICYGEKIEETWCKKLVASGAVIAKDVDEARAIAIQIETDKTFVPK